MMTAIPTIIGGAMLYVYLPVTAIAAILGCFLIISVPLRRVLKKRNFVVGLRGLSVVGSGYGIAAGTVIGAGLLLAPFLLGAGLAGEGLVGIVAALGFTVNVIKTLVFGGSELLNLELAVAGVLIGLCTIPGAYTGRWVVQHTPIRVHTILVEVMILCGAGYFLYQALQPIG